MYRWDMGHDQAYIAAIPIPWTTTTATAQMRQITATISTKDPISKLAQKAWRVLEGGLDAE